jgi:surface antigen
VLALRVRRIRRRALYSGSAGLRLSGRLRRFAPLAALLGLFVCTACSYPLDSMLSGSDSGGATGSVHSSVPARAADAAAVGQLSETDLAYARATAVQALSNGASDNSVPWQNPQTGAGGNITPLAASHSEDGAVCRDFLASYGRPGAQAWLQGSACRTSGGAWEVRTLKPLKSG